MPTEGGPVKPNEGNLVRRVRLFKHPGLLAEWRTLSAPSSEPCEAKPCVPIS